MKSLVVLAAHPQFAEAVQAVAGPLGFRVVHRLSVDEAEPLLLHGLADVCVVDADAVGVEGHWVVERIVRRAPACCVIVFSEGREPEVEEALHLAGASHVFGKPIRGRLLAQALQRLSERPGVRESRPAVLLPVAETPSAPAGAVCRETVAAPADLTAVRRFSEMLTHSLDAEALVRRFLGLLREMVAVNRSAVFLRSNPQTARVGKAAEEMPWMTPACAVGLAPALIDQCALSSQSGIGACILQTGRILRRESREAATDATQQEFDLLGAEVAVPIMGRDELVGVAVFDRRITGHPLSDGDLESIFHLLEQVGLAITNTWTFDRLADSNELLGDVLRELGSACVVVGPDLKIAHANRAARRVLGPPGRRSEPLEFAELPAGLAGRIYQVLRTGAAIPAFRYEAQDAAHSVFSVTVVPIRASAESPARDAGALLVMEDRTQAEQLQQLEVEAANLRLISTMADRLAAEIGNAIVPLSVHHQLFDQRIKEAEFRKTLKNALGDGVKRVNRLANQMRFIYGSAGAKTETLSLRELLEEANREALGSFPGKSAKLDCDTKVQSATVSGDRRALQHSFAEIILNAYQANPENPNVAVRLADSAKGNGAQEVGIEFEDKGKGFSEDTARQAVLPFFTQRAVGVGLGLSAVRRIVEDHGGRLEIPSSKSGKHGVVRVFLPAAKPQE